MPVDRIAALADIDAVLNHNTGTSGLSAVTQLAALHRACIERNAPAGSSYRRDAEAIPRVPPQGTGLSRPEQYLRATLQALRADYEQDRVRTFEEAVHAHVFRDLFEQATHLLEANLLLAAAVVAGAAFEQHLRHLAARNGIALTDSRGRSKAGSAFNTELRTQANAYDIAVERQNQVWIDYRNQAAHNNAEFQNRTADQIRGMIQGARDFATQHPA